MNEVTCLICFYYNDDLKKFKIALNSIFNQVDVQLKIVIVVDGPIPDQSETYIKSLNSGYIIDIIWLPFNVGHGEARRIGLKNVKTPYISIFDSDDLSYPQRLKYSIEYLNKNENIGVVSGNIRELWESGEITFRNCSKLNFKYSSPVNQNCCTMRTSAYRDAGGYLSWYCNEDTYLWIRMALHGWSFGSLNQVLVEVNMNLNSLKRRKGWRYFKSEIGLRHLMYENKLINIYEFIINFIIRFLIQLILPIKFFKIIYLWRRKKL